MSEMPQLLDVWIWNPGPGSRCHFGHAPWAGRAGRALMVTLSAITHSDRMEKVDRR
jgi:hypothetical protein